MPPRLFGAGNRGGTFIPQKLSVVGGAPAGTKVWALAWVCVGLTAVTGSRKCLILPGVGLSLHTHSGSLVCRIRAQPRTRPQDSLFGFVVELRGGERTEFAAQ